MAFSTPTFNLVCEVWSGPWLSKSFRFESPCNLAFGRRVNNYPLNGPDPGGTPWSFAMDLLLPKATNIRDKYMGYDNDIIECPAGTGRWYQIMAFDDVGKGFDNEYRIASLVKIAQVLDVEGLEQYTGLDWPDPTP